MSSRISIANSSPIYLLVPVLSSKAEIIDSTKGIMTEAAQNQIQVIKNNFKECHARR